ncbi:NAD(P)/FAD-dependent oxidoreductase [Stutzerimonas azotifigens]|uniref:NAD(P)/FAD-dependent oxidoreductase n=1 Tax=Stutzerimonas azotifigens TaxID=291995 RepID=UPI000422B938|nr:NAD(P)/FAD-dependent oxidoreductase [Stutzerimonas azotifigens]
MNTDARVAHPPPEHQADVDCVVVGAGPAGLTAAVYLARFHRSCRVIDAGCSRAAWIPTSHNYPGFPPGISGRALIERLYEQACRYGAEVVRGVVEEIRPHTLGFEVRYDGHGCVARRVILATGIQDSLPAMDDADAAILSGTVRLCAICDGYEVDGHEVAVYGEAESTIGHAVFLRSFTDRVTVIAKPGQPPREEALALVRHYGIRYLEAEVGQVHYRPGEGVEVVTRDGARHRFELLYPNLGARVRSELAQRLGAACDPGGCLQVDDHRQTTVPGLYAIGDVVSGLKQMSIAVGHAAQAATAVHNSLEARPWSRPG